MLKTLKLLTLILLAILSTRPAYIFAWDEAKSGNGSLIVTYHSENPNMHLDRVRFWLINDQQQRRLYPQGNAYVDNEDDQSRMVLVENLPVGNYALQFVVPNRNQAYRSTPLRTLSIATGSVVKIDQAVGVEINPTPEDTSTIALVESNVYVEQPESVIFLPKSGQRIYSYPSTQQIIEEEGSNIQRSAISIKSNLSNGRWKLYHNDRLLLSGEGSRLHIPVIPGDGYHVEADDFDDFSVRVFPRNYFFVRAGHDFTVELSYRKKFGLLEVALEVPTGEQVELSLEGPLLPRPIHSNLTAVDHAILWTSKPLPLGSYTLNITPSDSYVPMEPINIQIKRDEITTIAPKLVGNRSLHVSSNTDEAIYLLRTQDGNKAWKGEGKNFTFQGLIPGSYILTYASTSPQKEIPPPSKNVTLNKNGTREISVQAVYNLSGQLYVKSNIENYHLKIEDLNHKLPTAKENVENYAKDFDLPAGRYRISFLPLPGKSGVQVPRPITVTIKSEETTDAIVEYGPMPSPPVKKSKEDVEMKNIATPTSALLIVAATKSILGDPFNDNKTNDLPAKEVSLKAFKIGAFEITNGQYAQWLTNAHKEGKVKYQENGIVTDTNGKLLCKTSEAAPLSQINADKQTNGEILFIAAIGKSDHPVIFVSWYGAQQFCQDHQCRLPTEAEWETAAGVIPESEPIKKYRFGFSRNEISPASANYKESNPPIAHEQVLTTPVGFYNGINLLPLNSQSTEQPHTQLAQSPIGAYDMSGNVWEWVSDWWYSAEQLSQMPADNPQGPENGDKKIVKGGCYDSLSDGVRVAERMALPPDHTDAFTGFRIAQQ